MAGAPLATGEPSATEESLGTDDSPAMDAPRKTDATTARTPKALLPWLGRPLIQYQLEQISAATAAHRAAQGPALGVAHVVVVTGFHAERLAPCIEPFPGVRMVENPDPARGRASSIVHGVAALPDDLSAIAIVNVDQPIAADTLAQLLAAHSSNCAPLTVPRYREKRGHPPLFANALRQELLRVGEETQGLKAVTRANRASAQFVEVDDPGAVWNLNTPEDYERAQEQHILLATTNAAKAAHLAWLLHGLPLRRVSLADANLADVAPPTEYESTLEAIAAHKACAWSRAFGGLAIASDGGIAIPALGDRWEERLTARFAGAEATDRQRVEALLALLQPYHGEERRASFRESVALARNGTLLQSWSAESGPGVLAADYDSADLVPGFWLLTLWCDATTGTRVGARKPDDPAYPNGAWARIKPGVQAFVSEYCRRALTPAAK